MTAAQIVFAATAAAVVVAIVLICAGVALLAGHGWALVSAGALIALSAIGSAVVLLRDGGANG